jgi:tetratricopeptide (TPR) repeat protein
MTSAPRHFLAASLIVRDEAEHVAGAITSLLPLVDVVHVHDTGSVDGTVAIASGLGAVVTTGPWTGDFAAARNEGLLAVSSSWVLMLDADERVTGDAAALRVLLRTTASDVLTVAETHLVEGASFAQRRTRLFRPDRARWAGALHESLVGTTGDAVVTEADAAILHVEHLGYRDRATRERKALRNNEIAHRELDALAADAAPDPLQVAQALYDLGRGFVSLGRRQDAVDAFEAVRELAPGTTVWLRATDLLAQLLLSVRMHEVALVLAEQLLDAGAPPAYCAWLRARALPHLGRFDEAWELLRDVDQVVDLSGAPLDAAEVGEIRALLRDLRVLAAGGAA